MRRAVAGLLLVVVGTLALLAAFDTGDRRILLGRAPETRGDACLGGLAPCNQP